MVKRQVEGRHEDDAHQPGMAAVTAIAKRSRADLLRPLTGLRHLAGSTDPPWSTGYLPPQPAPVVCRGHATLQAATDGPCDIPEAQRR